MARPAAQSRVLQLMRRFGFPVSRKGQIAVFMGIKLLLMGLFSSGYQNQLFLPFTTHFAVSGGNPWDYYWQHPELGMEFPYHPLMLYILTPFAWLIQVLGIHSLYGCNLIFKLPTLIADCLIAFSLLKLFPDRGKNIIFFYVLSPITFYACYLHSQLDLIPTAFLFMGIQYLKQFNWKKSALLYGASLAIKLHVLAVYPLAVIYLFRNDRKRAIVGFSLLAFSVYLFFTLPYLHSAGFDAMVLHNQKQANIFEFYATIGNIRIYWVLFALMALFSRFLLYKKINADLLDAYTMLVFSVFLLLVVPSPGWYVWLVPFLSLLLIRHFRQKPAIAIPYNFLCMAYIAYFLFFHVYDFQSLYVGVQPVLWHVNNEALSCVAFTALEAMLFSTLLMGYRVGVLSNSIYGMARAIVVGVGGDSGAGKSTLLSDMKAMLGRQMLEIEGDGDHKWERGNQQWKTYTHLDPKANFLHRQAEAIQLLKKGQPVFRSDYDHATGQFTEPRQILPQDYILLSGLHPFYLPKMRKLIDLKVYLDPQEELKHYWKLRRDVLERGHSKEAVLAQIHKRKTDAEKHIEPQKDFADLVIRYEAKKEDFSPEAMETEPEIRLCVTMDSSINLENLLEMMQQSGYKIEWDYTDDLRFQCVWLSEEPKKEDMIRIVDLLIPNIYEITMQTIDWRDGYRGFIQMLVLFILSDLKKEKVSEEL